MPHPVDDRLAKRNALVLAVAQSLGGANPAIVVSLGGLVGLALAPSRELATVPVSLLQLGLACGTIPAAILMRRFGRRTGYLLGGMLGVFAGAIAAAGIGVGSFLLFCLGTFVAGTYGSFVQSYRFAAADSASQSMKGRVISFVMAGGVVAGIIGPQVVIWTRDAVPGAPFAGGFLGQAALALMSIVVVSFLRAAPMPPPAPGNRGRPLPEIVRQPRFIAAVVPGLVSYGMMSFMMTAAPLAMVECGYSVGTAALGIQWHILAMYGPSFVTGYLIDRFGKEQVTGAGLVLMAAAAFVGLHGISVAHFWGALVLLGVGWNFSFIGATALVTECYRPEERTKVQGANDFVVFGAVAIASFSSGRLLAVSGWSTVSWLVLPPLAVACAFLVWGARQRSRAPALAETG